MTTSPPAQRLQWRVTREEDAIWSGSELRRLARLIGFSDRACAEMGIALGELVTNAAKYGGGGIVEVTVVQTPRVGIRIVVEDEGPGIPDVETALRDGYSEGLPVEDRPADRPRRGLGAGLGAAKRLLDELDIAPRPGGGTRITGTKYLPK